MEKLLFMLFEVSLSMSFCIIFMLLIKSSIKEKYGSSLIYFIWLFIAIRLVIPINFNIPNAMEIPVSSESTIFVETRMISNSMENTLVQDSNNSKEFSIDANNQIQAPDYNGVSIILVTKIIYIIWFAGFIGMLLYQCIKYLQYISAIKKSSKKCCDEVQQVYRRILKESQCKKKIELLENCNIASPMLMGIGKLKIIVNSSKLTNSQLEMVFKHELIHATRNDLLFKWLLMTVRCIHWFNPLVYRMCKEANNAIELSCDEKVLMYKDINYRKDYGNAMIEILKKCGESKDSILTTSFNGDKKIVKERFLLLIDTRMKPKNRKICIFALIVVLLSTTLVACVKEQYPLQKKIINQVMSIEESKYIEYTFFKDIGIQFQKSSKNIVKDFSYDINRDCIRFTVENDGEQGEVYVYRMSNNIDNETYRPLRNENYLVFDFKDYLIQFKGDEKLKYKVFDQHILYTYKGLIQTPEEYKKNIKACVVVTPITDTSSYVNLSIVTLSQGVRPMSVDLSKYVKKLGLNSSVTTLGRSKELDDACEYSKYETSGFEQLFSGQVEGVSSIEEFIKQIEDQAIDLYVTDFEISINVNNIVYNKNNQYDLNQDVSTTDSSYRISPDKITDIDFVLNDDKREYPIGKHGARLVIPNNLDSSVHVGNEEGSNSYHIYLKELLADEYAVIATFVVDEAAIISVDIYTVLGEGTYSKADRDILKIAKEASEYLRENNIEFIYE